MVNGSAHFNADTHRRAAFALLTTMLLITLLIAGAAELASLTSTEAIVNERRIHTLQHELAVNSALLILADRLARMGVGVSPLIRSLDQTGEARTTVSVGDATAICTFRDDGAKFNPSAFQEPHQRMDLKRKLTLLAATRALPHVTVALHPFVQSARPWEDGPTYHWFDQLLTDVRPGALFRLDESGSGRTVWSDAITFWGDGRVDLRRVDRDALEAALEDIRPGLARRMLVDRPADPTVDFSSQALTRVDAEIRQRVAGRLTFDARRYAIRIDTSIGADQRRWYVVARIEDGEVEVLHRSRLRW